MDNNTGERSYTLEEYLARIEPQYREHKGTMRSCIAGLTEYAVRLAAQHQEEQLPQLRRLCVEMAEFWGLTDDDTPKGYREIAEQYGRSFDRAVSAAGESGHAPEMSELSRQNILDGLELYAQELRANAPELEQWAVECDVLAEELQVKWQTDGLAEKMKLGGINFG